MEKQMKIRRKHYFIHPSSQLKYIFLAIIPLAVMGLFCSYFLVQSGEYLFKIKEESVRSEIDLLRSDLNALTRHISSSESFKITNILQKRLIILQEVLKVVYYDAQEQWAKLKMMMVSAFSSVIIIVGILALLYSHRVAGPMFRIRHCLEMFAQGKDTSMVKLRSYDEFKEIAISLENLRKLLKEKGVIK
jgi:hypothetical protein